MVDVDDDWDFDAAIDQQDDELGQGDLVAFPDIDLDDIVIQESDEQVSRIGAREGVFYKKLVEVPPWGGATLRILHEEGDPNARILLQCGRTHAFVSFSSHEATVAFILKKSPMDRHFCEYYFQDMPIMVPFDIDLKDDCKKPLGSGCQQCCACNDINLPQEDSFIRATLDWVIRFMLDYYGVQVKYMDIKVATACRPSKLSLHLAVPFLLETGERRAQFRAHLRHAGEGRRLMHDLTGVPVPVVDPAIYSRTGQALRGVHCNSWDSVARAPKRNWLKPLLALEDGTPLASWPSNFRQQLLEGMVSLPRDSLPHLPDSTQQAIVTPLPHAKRRRPPLPTCHSHVIASALEADVLRLVGPNVSVMRWENENMLYMRTNGARRCPHGNVHRSDNFVVRIDGMEVVYCCYFTPECSAPLESIVGTLPAKWRVPREQYVCTRIKGSETLPCVRPLTFAATTNAIVETTECGGGKTEQMVRLVEGMSKDASVVYITHRVLLTQSALERLHRLDFVTYLSEPRGPITAHRLVICLPSVYRIQRDSFDLLVVDEFAEVRRELPTIGQRGLAGGKWTVWQAFRRLVSQSKHRLFLSAHSDLPELHLLDLLGVEASWQQNGTPLLSHLRYRIIYTDSDEHAMADIVARVQVGERLVVPCAENKMCQLLFKVLEQRCPDKHVLALHAHLDPEKRREVIEALERRERPRTMAEWMHGQWDCILYTASMDTGVSISNHDLRYTKCIALLSNHSISAEVCIQMIQRFRQLRDNEIVIYCSSRIRDWTKKPGYDHVAVSSEDVVASDLLCVSNLPALRTGGPSVNQVKRHLDRE